MEAGYSTRDDEWVPILTLDAAEDLQCRCREPRKLRASPAVVAAGAILCGVCKKEFKVVE